MPESFGARLRQQREKRGVALAALAKQTRIKESLLDALERDDLSQWPNGFYRRAFFRAYASAIQLDADAAFREFQQVHPEPPEGDVLAAMAATLGVEQGRNRMGIRSAVESAFSSLARLRSATPEPPRATGRAQDGDLQVHVPHAIEPTAIAVDASAAPRDNEPRELGREVVEAPAGLPGELAPPPAPSAPSALYAPSAPFSAPGNEQREPQRLDLGDLALLCVELGCVTSEEGLRMLLKQAAGMIGAAGLIVWAWDQRESQLEPALAHGYPLKLVAQLPAVRETDDNATAEAFRTVETRVFNDSARGKSALAIPLRTAAGCVGVFAVELQRGLEATKSRIAVATLVASHLAPIVDSVARPGYGLPLAVNGGIQTV